MHILLTNDDGIKSQGIFALYRELCKLATITVVAPDRQRSSTGHAITLSRLIRVRKLHLKRKFEGYGVSGTPADCVKYALQVLLKRKPDLIISGINLGPNDGVSVFYSGTVAAAREGSFHHIPAIAVSLDTFQEPDYSFAAKACARIVKKKLKEKTGFQNIFLNINVPHLPAGKIKGFRITRQSTQPFKTVLKKQSGRKDDEHYAMSCENQISIKDVDSDTAALKKGYVSVTPLLNDLTSKEAMRLLQKQHLF